MSKIELILDNYLYTFRPETRRRYGGILRKWCEHLALCGADLTTADTEHVLEYFVALRASGAADGTIKVYFATLSSLYGYLHESGHVAGNVMKQSKRLVLSRQHTLVRPTKLIDFKRVKEGIERLKRELQTGDIYAVRKAALFAIMFGTGMRRSEVVGLDVGDVLTSPAGVPFLRLKTDKSGKGRAVAVPEWAWEIFSVFVSKRKTEGAKEGDPLFINYRFKNKKRLSVDWLYQTYRSYFDAAPHSSRATFATKLLSQGIEKSTVAHALGHASDAMVQVYDKRVKSVEQSAALEISFES